MSTERLADISADEFALAKHRRLRWNWANASLDQQPDGRSTCTTGRWVGTISPEAAELSDTRERDRKDIREHVMPPAGFRTLVALDSPYLDRDGKLYRLSAGMLVSAEVNLGSRRVIEYLLAAVQKTVLEADRER